MELEHHIKARAATNAILKNFKTGNWLCGKKSGANFFRTKNFNDFPSPDATFADEGKNFTVSFEFKPPTETKRGILTGLGQVIAYLQRSSVSFLIAPEEIEGYNMKGYLNDLFKNLLKKIPVGLITYDINDPSKVDMIVNVKDTDRESKGYKKSNENRYWAKHQDLPLPLFYMILHYYYLKKTGLLNNVEPYAACWKDHMASHSIVDNLEVQATTDLDGRPIKTMNGDKNVTYCENILENIKKKYETDEERKKALSDEIATEKSEGYKGSWDNNYNRVRRYILAFFKQINMIDSNNDLTEKGFKLYQVGLINGAESKLFKDYFAREVLITGCHFDLIVDFDKYFREKFSELGSNIGKFMNYMEEEYEKNGYIKRNPNRKAKKENHKAFLAHERALWRYLDLMDSNYVVDWKRIIEVCTLPDL